MVYLISINYKWLLSVDQAFCESYTSITTSFYVDQQNRAFEAATITLRYFMALCPTMGKKREISDLHFLAKPGFFQANCCDVTKAEVPSNLINIHKVC